MTRFTDTLTKLNDRLDLPQPVRSRILLEIASNLEALYPHFRGDGLCEEAARRQAVEHCDLSDEARARMVCTARVAAPSVLEPGFAAPCHASRGARNTTNDVQGSDDL